MYFVSFAVVKWLNVFTRSEYQEIVIDSLMYCQTNKGMKIFAWCIMPDHMHLVFRCEGENKPGNVLGDFKRFTSKKIVAAIASDPRENRKEYFLKEFELAGNKSSNVKTYQFWRHDNHPIELWSNRLIQQKVDYVHNNPVKAGFVDVPRDYPYSSAIDYAGEQGLLPKISIAPI